MFVSAVLYRIPRGGGLGEGRSFEGALIWASVTGLLSASMLWHWLPIACIPLLMLGEAPGWSKWWPNQPGGGNVWRLSLRGCLLLNPLMGPIYFWCYNNQDELPDFGEWADDWTEWSELACGFVTAAVFYLLMWWIVCSLLT